MLYRLLQGNAAASCLSATLHLSHRLFEQYFEQYFAPHYLHTISSNPYAIALHAHCEGRLVSRKHAHTHMLLDVDDSIAIQLRALR